MRMKPVILTAISLLALACLCTPLSQIATDSEPAPTSSGSGATSDLASVISNEHFTLVQLHPVGGELDSLLPLYAEAALAQGRKPFVEWDAEW
jgi:hypothetical protein